MNFHFVFQLPPVNRKSLAPFTSVNATTRNGRAGSLLNSYRFSSLIYETMHLAELEGKRKLLPRRMFGPPCFEKGLISLPRRLQLCLCMIYFSIFREVPRSVGRIFRLSIGRDSSSIGSVSTPYYGYTRDSLHR